MFCFVDFTVMFSVLVDVVQIVIYFGIVSMTQRESYSSADGVTLQNTSKATRNTTKREPCAIFLNLLYTASMLYSVLILAYICIGKLILCKISHPMWPSQLVTTPLPSLLHLTSVICVFRISISGKWPKAIPRVSHVGEFMDQNNPIHLDSCILNVMAKPFPALSCIMSEHNPKISSVSPQVY